jgi:hypothetical protein
MFIQNEGKTPSLMCFKNKSIFFILSKHFFFAQVMRLVNVTLMPENRSKTGKIANFHFKREVKTNFHDHVLIVAKILQAFSLSCLIKQTF